MDINDDTGWVLPEPQTAELSETEPDMVLAIVSYCRGRRDGALAIADTTGGGIALQCEAQVRVLNDVLDFISTWNEDNE